MKPLFLFVRPPRPLWPFNGPSTAFWPPLAFASMAAALREKVAGLRVAILDAPALSMGWTTLARQIHDLHPAYVALGEEAVSCIEGLRLARLAKHFGARLIAGGCFFSHVAPQVLRTRLIDVVVHGEGEQTIVELMQLLMEPGHQDLRPIPGLSFLEGEEVLFTGHRKLLADLDALPFPAYDLLPIDNYGAKSRNHPNLAAIELGRGCSHGCSFCVLWRQMGQFQGDRPSPCLRVKSPERLREEVRILMDRFDRLYLGWVDPCFNGDPTVPAQLAELLLREDRAIGQSAWVRADYVVRDAASGALDVCHRSGLNELYMGLERLDPDHLAAIGKKDLAGHGQRALAILDEHYRGIVTIGTFIYGLREDTRESVQALFRSAQQLPLDELFFIPLTPLPGTAYWKPQMWDPEGKIFLHFDFLPRPGSDQRLAEFSAEIARSYLLCWPKQRFRRMLNGLFARDARRRTITRHIFGRTIPVMLPGLFHRKIESPGGMFYPAWYES